MEPGKEQQGRLSSSPLRGVQAAQQQGLQWGREIPLNPEYSMGKENLETRRVRVGGEKVAKR